MNLQDAINDFDRWEKWKRRETIGDDAHVNLFKLADELEAKDKEKYAKIIDRCRRGVYHDFATNEAFPKMKMHTDLLDAGLIDVDNRMQDGEFDS